MQIALWQWVLLTIFALGIALLAWAVWHMSNIVDDLEGYEQEPYQ